MRAFIYPCFLDLLGRPSILFRFLDKFLVVNAASKNLAFSALIALDLSFIEID
jgi:hypothetical protein